ncbi:MAG TPA: GNAT family N-acetyltransferase [Caulobacteraceae bacterium]|nr:GNAT family N-acetyltransferase [Caulobacteraceae bacterium]
MDAAEILRRYDAELRADPPAEVGVTRTWADGVLRTEGAYDFIGWWTFGADEAAAAVAREAAHFAARGVQWKVYGHDGPANLADELAAAGFQAEEPETFVVLDMEAAMPPLDPPPGVEVRQVLDRAGIDTLVAVSNAAFGSEEPWRADQLAGRLADPTQALFVAFLDGAPVSSGRLELAPGKAFAGLYGGGTVPAQQGRGVYRALVAARAAEARRRGHRFLTVDARETSRPILERLGFQPLDVIRDWVLPARQP